VAALLQRWNVDPRLLEFEVTESAMLTDPTRTTLILERLSTMGVRLSIDDFGTGYSSLASLRRMPVSEIKIDRAFVMNMDTDENDATIVRCTIDLGRNLGLDVVAEGVETEQTWNRLKELGCTAAQGYYLSRAVPAPQLQTWLLERRKGAGHGRRLDQSLPPSAGGSSLATVRRPRGARGGPIRAGEVGDDHVGEHLPVVVAKALRALEVLGAVDVLGGRSTSQGRSPPWPTSRLRW
jgi:hypothetical protein